MPQGWHPPSEEEYELLLTYLGGEGKEAFSKIIHGNTERFNALFGGHRSLYWDYSPESGYYGNMNRSADFWSATHHYNKAWFLCVRDAYRDAGLSMFPKEYAFYVRLVKDQSEKK